MMPAGDETATSAAAILQQRLAALRFSNPSSSSPFPSGTLSTIKTGDGLAKNDEEEDENLSQLLASLDVPDDTGDDESDDDTDFLNDGIDVPIQVKNVDEQVTHYLKTASQLPSTATLPPLSSSTSQTKLEATLSSYETLAPNFVSPIEVSFFTPPSTNLSGPSGGIRGDEEEALMARLRDELSVERAVQSREGNVEDVWERRLSKMKEFRPITDPDKERECLERAKGLGEGPALEGVEELQRRRKSRENKGRRKRGSGSEEDTDSEEDTESESDEDSDEE
ncbi:BQ5605_C009g05732 [Microbotryum silenes-dioicae]|uniref:BQ5605_C009g05732 protein n=1 Tax=Microbotryum silenes-dioicae TaxID=796604 RepID=A0A2X0MIK0_9BASI|nr:BQ5605_C009g05732 [Microbotryum silenes-dioicae]